jgi:ferredoxin
VARGCKQVEANFIAVLEQSKPRPFLTSCSSRLSPAFFSRNSGTGILHSHDHLTIPVSSASNRGCYHKREFEIPPYFYPLSVNFFAIYMNLCVLYPSVILPLYQKSTFRCTDELFLKFPVSASPVLLITVHIPLSLYRQCVFTSVRNNTMNISIDRGACVSCGACWNICPELFDQNHCDSYSEVVENFRFNGNRAEGIVPDYLCCCAQEAADLCPVQIIRVC